MGEKLEIWVSRLRDANPSVRQDAIRHLEALGDSSALGPLAGVFALDTDMETRKLARWAGKSIYHSAERRASQKNEYSDDNLPRAAEILAKAQAKKTGSPKYAH